MTTPAILVDATVARKWGLTIIDPTTRNVVPDEELVGAYVIMEGNGRFEGYLISLALTDDKPAEYSPIDYHFVYKHYDSPEAFGEAYTSTNCDMTRTTSKDRLKIAIERSNDPLIKEYMRKVEEDSVIAKASYFWTFGRELKALEVTGVVNGTNEAPIFDHELTDTLQKVYAAFKEAFGEEGASHIYRGTPAAQWCADVIKNDENKAEMGKAIIGKLKNISRCHYTAIITAKSNRKKELDAASIIRANLDQMMK